MRLYIVRHADPNYAIDNLTDSGHAEAQALSHLLATKGLTALYSSPKGRALATAEYTANATGLPVTVEKWAAELEWRAEVDNFGTKRMTKTKKVALWDLPSDQLRGESGDLYETNCRQNEWQTFGEHFAKVKPEYESICKSSDEFLKELGFHREGGRYRILRQNNRDQVAMFCHNGLGLTWLSHLLAMPLSMVYSSFWLAPSSVTTVLFDEVSEEWAVPRCLGVGDISHLTKAGLQISMSKHEGPNMDRPSGIKHNWL